MTDDDAYRAWRRAEGTLLFHSQRYLAETAYRGPDPDAAVEELTAEGGLHLEALRVRADALFVAWLTASGSEPGDATQRLAPA